MKLSKGILVIGLFLCSFQSFAQQRTISLPSFTTNLIYNGSDNLDLVAKDVAAKSQLPAFYKTDADVKAEIEKYRSYDNALNSQKSNIKLNNSQLLENNSTFLKCKDILLDRQTIAENIKSKNDFEKEFDQNLKKQSSQRGLYLVVLPAGAETNDYTAEKFKAIAQKELAPKAVKQLGENYIKTVLTMVNNTDVKQKLESKVKGKMEVREVLYEKRRLSSGDYIMLLDVSVSPYEEATGQENVASGMSGVTIINAADQQELERIINTKAIESSQAELIRQRATQKAGDIAWDNADSKNVFNTLYNDFNSRINEANQRISTKMSEINTKKQLLDKLTITLMGNSFSGSTMKDTLSSLDVIITKGWEKISNDLLALEKQRIYLRESKEKGLNDRTVNAAISEEIIDMRNQMKTDYTNYVIFDEALVMNNKIIESYEKENKTYTAKDLDKIWVYVVPTDNDGFKFTVFATLKTEEGEAAETKAEEVKPSNTKMDTIWTQYGSINNPFAIQLDGAGVYQEGDIVTVRATSNENFSFINWSENGNVVSTSANYSFEIEGNRVLDANFEKYEEELKEENVIESYPIYDSDFTIEVTYFNYSPRSQMVTIDFAVKNLSRKKIALTLSGDLRWSSPDGYIKIKGETVDFNKQTNLFPNKKSVVTVNVWFAYPQNLPNPNFFPELHEYFYEAAWE